MSDRHGEVLGSRTRRRPFWHVWSMGVFFLLLNSVGAYDNVRTLAEDAAYFRSQDYGEAQIGYFTNYPFLPAIIWSISVGSGVAASILLLARRRHATHMATVAVTSQLLLVLVTFGFMNRWSVFGAAQSLFDLSILLLTAGFALYCWVISARGAFHRRGSG